MAPRGVVGELDHPQVEEMTLIGVLHALADRSRLEIVTILDRAGERACGTFDVDVAPSTLSHHFKVLRQAGVIRQEQRGRERMTTLRRDELESRFPGLLTTLLPLAVGEAATPSPARVDGLAAG